MPTILPPAKTTFLGPNGEVLSGGSVAFSIPGTTTPKNTYQDSDQTILNQNPVPLDANGQALIWGTGSYRQRVYDANENLIWDQITEDTTAGLLGNMTNEMGSGGTPGFAANVDFTPGITTSLTLSTNYGSTPNLWVAFDSAEQGADSYSLSGTELTFVSPIPVGVNKVYVKGGSTIAIGTPGTGTITDASVAPGAAIQSSKLSYLQGAPGSVVRTVLSRLQDYVSVKDFGATGNGTTDDTDAIQAAIEAISINGGVLYFPPGTYKTTSTLTIGGSFVCLRGAGKNVSVIASTMTTGDTLIIGSSVSTYESVYVESIGFSPANAKTSGTEVHLQGNNINCYVRDCIFTGGYTHVYMDSYGSASNYHVEDCYLQSAANYSIVAGGANGIMTGVYLETLDMGSNYGHILLQNASGLYLNEIDGIESTGDSFSIIPGSGQRVTFGFFDTVQMDTCGGNAWVVQPTGTGRVSGIVCNKCWAAAAQGYGLLLNGGSDDLDGFTFSDGIVRGNKLDGVLLEGGQNIILSRNQVFNNSTSGSAQHSGISVVAGISSFTISDNICGAGGYDAQSGSPNWQAYGIVIQSGTGGDFVVTGNRCPSNVIAGYINQATGANQKVSNNTNGATFSTPSVPASGTSIINPAGRDIRVFVSNGTFSSVSINGNVVGVAGNVCDFILRSGETIGINYTSAPSWTMLDF